MKNLTWPQAILAAALIVAGCVVADVIGFMVALTVAFLLLLD